MLLDGTPSSSSDNWFGEQTEDRTHHTAVTERHRRLYDQDLRGGPSWSVQGVNDSTTDQGYFAAPAPTRPPVLYVCGTASVMPSSAVVPH